MYRRGATNVQMLPSKKVLQSLIQQRFIALSKKAIGTVGNIGTIRAITCMLTPQAISYKKKKESTHLTA